MSTHAPRSSRALAAAVALGSALVAVASTGHAKAAVTRQTATAYRAAHAANPAISPYPFTNGDTFTYALSETDTVAYPSASPVVTTSTDAETAVETCPVIFNGITGLCDFQFSFASQPQAFLDAYYGYVPKGQLTDFVDYGVNQAYANGANFTQDTYTYAPYQIFMQFPEAPGHHFDAYENLYRDASTTTGPQGYHSTSTTRDDRFGAYTEFIKTTYPHHLKSSLALDVNRNATATYQFTQTGYNKLERSIGAPIVMGGNHVIPVTVSGGNALPATPSPATTTHVPDWYPGGGAPPTKLDAFPTKDLGVVTVPAACGQYAGTQADEFRGIDYDLDPLLGYYETGEYDVFMVDGTGDVCDLRTYTTSVYDNLNTGALLYSETIARAVVLVSENQPDAKRGRNAQRNLLSSMALGGGRFDLKRHLVDGLVRPHHR